MKASDIIQALRDSDRGPLKGKELAKRLRVPNERYHAFRRLLKKLEREGKIYRVKGQRFALPKKINLVVGRLSITRRGDGFVLREDGGQDLFVPRRSLESAMDGDRVVTRIERRRRGENPEGCIVKVLERAHPSVVGVYHVSKRWAYVTPLDKKLSADVLVDPSEGVEAREGDVVVVRIITYGERNRSPVGEVETVLGALDDPGVDVLSVVHSYGLAAEFPKDVEADADRSIREWSDLSADGRTDRTELLLFTIDPADAKDHDDALSYERLAEGRHEVGIHIADVSYYVRRGSPLDIEAYRRGTSVYLVDRVIPMLPHSLSGGQCSLRPDEDRAAVSVFVELDDEARVRGHRFERTRIRSRARLSYEDAESILNGESPHSPEVDAAIRELGRLAHKVREVRRKRGSLDFDLPEAKVHLDEEGVPVAIHPVERLESHRLIEDFMILANEVVAREGEKRKLPVLYRIHEKPDPDRLEDLRALLGPLGYTLPQRAIRSKDIQAALRRSVGRPEEQLVSMGVLRSMNRAKYSAQNIGHFGLGSTHYSHFTSPIRRYADLVTHRSIVRALIDGERVPEEWSTELPGIAAHVSERERVADEAERDSIDMKKVEYMERHLGDELSGVITGVTAFGFFVLPDEVFAEGLVHVNTLNDDYYAFQPERLRLVGERRGRTFELGDRVRVQVSRVDKADRHIDFLLMEE